MNVKLDKVKIDVLMAKKQIKKAELSKIYGVSRNRIYVILNSREISLLTAEKLAKALDVNVTEIIE